MNRLQKALKTALYVTGIALCMGLLSVQGYPPTATAQDSAVNQHLQNTDANVVANAAGLQRQWARMEQQRVDVQKQFDADNERYYLLETKVEVMYGIWDLVKWLIGGLVLIFGGQLALTWKQNKAS